ncbi:MAG: hypothetical protein ACT4PT_10660 [Methanobacteriota archaeon]
MPVVARSLINLTYGVSAVFWLLWVFAIAASWGPGAEPFVDPGLVLKIAVYTLALGALFALVEIVKNVVLSPPPGKQV